MAMRPEQYHRPSRQGRRSDPAGQRSPRKEKQPVILANLLVSTRSSFVVSSSSGGGGERAATPARLCCGFASVLPAIQQLRPPAAAIKTVIWLFHRRLLAPPPVKGLNHPFIATAMTRPHPRQNNGPCLKGSRAPPRLLQGAETLRRGPGGRRGRHGNHQSNHHTRGKCRGSEAPLSLVAIRLNVSNGVTVLEPSLTAIGTPLRPLPPCGRGRAGMPAFPDGLLSPWAHLPLTGSE